MSKARIKLTGRDPRELDKICVEIKKIADRLGTSIKGPAPLPTKKIKIPTLKTPCGSGTGHGNATWDKWEMRIHKRLIDIGADQRALHHVLRVEIPDDVNISIEMKD